ncbi:MAG: hypothetical protein WBP88_14805 [Nitrososphaeraceae archaeon]
MSFTCCYTDFDIFDIKGDIAKSSNCQQFLNLLEPTKLSTSKGTAELIS